MAEGTLIEWARHPRTGLGATWNPVTGCKLHSPGCTDCYAMKLAGTRLKHHPSRGGLTDPSKAGPVWNGKTRFNEQWLTQPFGWRQPHGIFTVAHGDLFYEAVAPEAIDQVFAVMALCPHHLFFILTKRPGTMLDYLADPMAYGRILRAADALRAERPELGAIPISNPMTGSWWPHVWLGTSVENQTWADARREPMDVLSKMGWTTFVSYEPAIGPVDWRGWEFLAWMISGGESGRRPSHPNWHRAARDFCAAHALAYFFKQWGSYGPDDGPLPDGRDPIMTGDSRCARWLYDRWDYAQNAWDFPFSDSDELLYHFKNKKDAGRILDGVEHSAYPEIRG